MSLSPLSPLRQVAARILKKPLLSFLVVMPLAVGIASTSTMYGLIHDVLLRPLPFPNANRLVSVSFTPANNPTDKEGTNAGGYLELVALNKSFTAVGAVHSGINVTLSPARKSAAAAEWVNLGQFTSGVLPALNVLPELGRWFRPGEMEAGRDDVIILSDAVWRRQFGADPNVLGRRVFIDDAPVTVVGVMPPAFDLFGDQVWAPQPNAGLQRALRSPNRVFRLVARLKRETSFASAQADMNLVARALGRDFPETSKGWDIKIEPLRTIYVGKIRSSLLLLQIAAFGLLLIACANAGGVLFAQTLARGAELAIRGALGATRGRLIGQLVTEGVLFACLASALGLLFAWAGLRLLSGVSTWIPKRYEVGLDPNVIAVSVLISIAAGVAASFIPALLQSRADLANVIRRSSRTVSRLGSRFQNGFVIAQIAIGVVLLCAAGLMVRSLMELRGADPGLDPTNVLSFQIRWPIKNSIIRQVGTTPNGALEVKLSPVVNTATGALIRRIDQISGIDGAAASVYAPLSGETRLIPMALQGRSLRVSNAGVVTTQWYPVSPQFFAVTRMRLKRGRTFNAEDRRSGAVPVAIINEAAARRLFGGANAIGRRVQLGILDDKPRRIVGVVSYVRQSQFASASAPQVYVPRSQVPSQIDGTSGYAMLTSTFVVRTRLPQAQVRASLREAVADIAPDLVIFNVRPLSDYAAAQRQSLQQRASILAVFGIVSLLLSLVGVFGLVAHVVSQQTREIGIRVALGATDGEVLRRLLLRTALLVALGILLGAGAALAVGRAIAAFLWHVGTADPVTFGVVSVVVFVTAVVAAYIPARRAVRLDTIAALRPE